MNEQELIKAFLAPFPRGGAGVVVGPGSDCAAVRPSRAMQLVVTTDAVVEGVHFDLRRFPPEDVGWKALAVNLSDLAAAGARPRWFVCALGVPPARAGIAPRIARGMAQLARRFDCALIGGNVTRARAWSITITALGEARRPLTRAGARPGDSIAVIGTLGNAAAGLRPRAPPAALKAQRRPEPLVDAGLLAARTASAMIDVSDGFLRDLGHLCRESGVGAVVEASALPVGSAATLQQALSGGEDYALIVTGRRLPGLRLVGKITRAPGIQLTRAGKPHPLPRRRGFDHFA